MFPVSLDKAGPKHSTSVPFSVGVAVPLRVDVKEVAFVPNPVTGVTVNVPLGPQIVEEVDVCVRGHSLLPPTLQMVIPLLSPVTLHVTVKISPGQVGGAAINCLPEGKHAKKTSSSGLEMRLHATRTRFQWVNVRGQSVHNSRIIASWQPLSEQLLIVMLRINRDPPTLLQS